MNGDFSRKRFLVRVKKRKKFENRIDSHISQNEKIKKRGKTHHRFVFLYALHFFVQRRQREKNIMPPKKKGAADVGATGGGGGDANLKQKSPAEFFQDNKGIAGFENAGKSLYTTLREFIENALDAAEQIGVLPQVDVLVEEVTLTQYETMIGLDAHVRKDDTLYDDFETEKAKAKRLEREAKVEMQQEKAAAAGNAGRGGKKGGGGRGGGGGGNASSKGDEKKSYFKITVKDNGKGMEHNDIPNMLGRVLSGTKYGVRQTRGKFGLGSKMALIWSKQTTGLPIRVRSAQPGQKFVSEYVLDIDIEKNAPNVHKEEKKPNTTNWHGAELSVTIEGNWTSHRQYVLAYLRQLAIVTPYAALGFRYISSHAAGSAAARNQDIQLHFARRAEVMPPLPRATKYHPSAAKENQLLVKDLLSNTKEKTLSGFFNKEFTCINREHANRLARELGAGFSASMHPKNVSDKQGARIQQLLASARFSDPSGDCLSPAGEYNLRLGVMKELGPDWIASYASPALACGGHPLIVEACVSLGGRDVKPGFNVFRFANRIPLLFEGGADVATRCVQRLNWTTYKIDKNNDKIGVFVSIVSTKIPFKGTSKEYIGDENAEIAEAVDKAIKQCASQLRGKIVRAQALKDRRARKKALTKYVPDCCNAIFTMLASAADADTLPHKRAKSYDEKEMLWPVDVEWEEEATQKARTREITAEILQRRLEECVEKIDNEEALEFSMQQNKDGLKQDVFLNPFSSFAHEYEPELRPGESGVAFRLLKKARLIA